ncbi:hypothetical protein [Luteimonas terricola]|uniref:DUF2007 domain-containing protein n=1 Tax=Luteimonas terricola TaxID=645597 RepID=A0ABQ2EEH3_9GAMM|nr:hypothetical protein [Luteimonas terricola]GGK08766.1 hypothetical protein GCM10011394_17750 [Luteimonas terricola]
MATSTPAQRATIQRLLRAQELPLDVVTFGHKIPFAAAGVPWRNGDSLDMRLAMISREQASALITELQEDDA